MNEQQPQPKRFRCPRQGCGKEFDTDVRMRGHIGGAHKPPTKNVRRHGLPSTYQWELRNKIPTCAPCKMAWANYNALGQKMWNLGSKGPNQPRRKMP